MNAFRTARKKLGLTQEALAAKAGTTQNTISELELGRNTNPTWVVLSAVAIALETTPEALIPPKSAKRSAPKDQFVASRPEVA